MFSLSRYSFLSFSLPLFSVSFLCVCQRCFLRGCGHVFMFNRRWSLYYVKGFGALKMSCPRSRSAKKQKKANPKWLKKKSISHQVARTHVFHNEDSKKKNAFVRSVSSLTHGIASRKLAGLHQLCFVSLFLYPSQILPPISCEKLEK